MIEKYPIVWCSNCESNVMVEICEMPPDSLNNHASADTVCPECSYIIATFHEKEPA